MKVREKGKDESKESGPKGEIRQKKQVIAEAETEISG